MDLDRVVSVVSTTDRGSGYVIAPRLVLTSAHVCGPVGTAVTVFAAGQGHRSGGTVAWRGTAGGVDDAALVEISDPGWRARTGRVRWGRVVTNRPGLDCEALGFPDWAQQDGSAAQTWHPSGTLNPGDRYVSDRYVMTLTGTPPASTQERPSPWGGLSGAALFCGDLLTGVVAADVGQGQHAYLDAVPMYVLERDPGFRAVLGGHGLGAMVLEPVELQRLIETEPERVGSPASLLRARHQVVPFRGRARLLEQLTAWAQGPGFAAAVLHGPGGQGKTRLAQELATRLDGDRWAWLWLRPEASVEQLAVLGDAAVPLLVIVDYAETRPEQVTAAVRAAARHGGTTPLRMLLLARTAGDWWDSLRAGDPHTTELLEGTPVALLDALEPEPAGQTEAYRYAVHGFADALPEVAGQQHRDWPAIATHLMERQPTGQMGGSRARWRGAVSALTLHMTALADLLDTADLLDQTDRQDTAHRDDAGELTGLARARSRTGCCITSSGTGSTARAGSRWWNQC